MNDFIQALSAEKVRFYLPTFKTLSAFESAKPIIKEDLYYDFPVEFLTLFNKAPHDESQMYAPLKQLITYLCDFIHAGQKKVAIQQKDEAFDLVTEMDQGIEYVLRYWIKKHFPTHKIIGEEFGQDHLDSKDYVWYIDPIDGTSNYAAGKATYCLNITCIYNGSPYLTFIGIPAEHYVYASHARQNKSIEIVKPALCSEFYSARVQDQVYFDKINSILKKDVFRTMALGYSLCKLYDGHCDVFYKANVKLWDVMAPAALLYFDQYDYWDIELQTYDGSIISPFSNNSEFLTYLNQRHKDNQRVGLFTVTKKTDSKSKQIIRECING